MNSYDGEKKTYSQGHNNYQNTEINQVKHGANEIIIKTNIRSHKSFSDLHLNHIFGLEY